MCSCNYYNGNIYAVGHGGYSAVIASNGQILAQRSGNESDSFEMVVLSSVSTNGTYTPFYTWSMSDDVSTSVFYVDPNSGTAELKNLSVVAPRGGYVIYSVLNYFISF